MVAGPNFEANRDIVFKICEYDKEFVTEILTDVSKDVCIKGIFNKV